MAVHEIRIDRSKTLLEEPGTGHNRWHPDIPPLVRCEPGDEVVLETRDASDGQMSPGASLETVAAPNLDVVHPLTGPVYVEGAEPGDLLGVEILDVQPDPTGTRCRFQASASARLFPPAVQGQLGHRRWLGYLGRSARGACSGLALHGDHRPGRPGTNCSPQRPRANMRCSTVAASYYRRRPRPRCLATGALPPRGCGRYRLASRPATSISSNSARARIC